LRSRRQKRFVSESPIRLKDLFVVTPPETTTKLIALSGNRYTKHPLVRLRYARLIFSTRDYPPRAYKGKGVRYGRARIRAKGTARPVRRGTGVGGRNRKAHRQRIHSASGQKSEGTARPASPSIFQPHHVLRAGDFDRTMQARRWRRGGGARTFSREAMCRGQPHRQRNRASRKLSGKGRRRGSCWEKR